MVEAYWLMGKRIVEEEQQGKERADYGTQLLKELSTELTKSSEKGSLPVPYIIIDSFITPFPKYSLHRGEY